MNHKTIKLHGGPQDGAVVKVLHNLTEYVVEIHHAEFKPSLTEPGLKFVYKETPHRSATDEVIFSCYDYMLELR